MYDYKVESLRAKIEHLKLGPKFSPQTMLTKNAIIKDLYTGTYAFRFSLELRSD